MSMTVAAWPLGTLQSCIAAILTPCLSKSYPRILCCTCSGTSLPPWPGMQRRSYRDLAGRGCCHIHQRRCRTDCHRRSPAGWALGCWRPACGCSPPDLWPPLSFPLRWKKKHIVWLLLHDWLSLNNNKLRIKKMLHHKKRFDAAMYFNIMMSLKNNFSFCSWLTSNLFYFLEDCSRPGSHDKNRINCLIMELTYDLLVMYWYDSQAQPETMNRQCKIHPRSIFFHHHLVPPKLSSNFHLNNTILKMCSLIKRVITTREFWLLFLLYCMFVKLKIGDLPNGSKQDWITKWEIQIPKGCWMFHIYLISLFVAIYRTLSPHWETADKCSYSAFMSSVTPPMNRLVSRLRPSVPRGLSPSMCGSLSTLSMALRRLRVTTSWCQRPWLICTLLTKVPVPEPVLNLTRGDTQSMLDSCRITFYLYHFSAPEEVKQRLITRENVLIFLNKTEKDDRKKVQDIPCGIPNYVTGMRRLLT